MGSKNSLFSNGEMQLYEELTGLNAAEINQYEVFLHPIAFKKFKQIDPLSFTKQRNGSISYLTVAENLKELKANPFRYRICKLFCSSENGLMEFEDFLDMVSVFSIHGSRAKKVAWAFKLYDFNDDEGIDAGDMHTLLDILTTNDLVQGEKDEIISKVFKVADRDGDAVISFEEFQRQLYFHPEFHKKFSFTL